MPSSLPLLRRLTCLFGFFALLTLPARAQTQCFEVLDAVTRRVVTNLCAGRTYYLHNCGPAVPFGLIIYDTGAGYGTASDTIVTYATPGTRRIKQLINNGMGNPEITKTYEVYPTAAPRVRVEPCLRNVRVRIADATYSIYLLAVSVNGQTPANSSAGTGSTVFTAAVAGTAVATVRVKVTGFTYVTGTTGAVCETTPFDTTLILPALPPPASIERLDVLAPTAAHQVELGLTQLVPGARYVVERSPALPAAAWTVIADTLRPTTEALTFTLNGAPTRTRHRYRVRQVALVGCDATLPPEATVSNEAGALPLTRVTLAGSVATVRWPDYPAAGTVLGWRVRRDGQTLPGPRLAANVRSYADAGAVGCPRPICYEVVAVVRPDASADTVLALSSDSCIRTPGALPLAPRLTASFDLANNLVLRARLAGAAFATGFQFTATRPPDPVMAIGTSSTPLFTIVGPDTAQVRGTCYAATLTDTCAQQSPASADACPIVLRGRRTTVDPANPSADLTWTPYVGFRGALIYSVDLLDDQTNALVRRVPVGSPAFAFTESLVGNQRQVLRYRVRAEVFGDTTQITYSNFVDLGEEQLVRLPTAFTPNGDNLNDTFVPVGRYELRTQELTIFDRWGREVYHTTTPGQGWDGRPLGGGDIVPPGVFAYRFRGRDALGHEFTKKGTVTVLR